MDEEYAKYLLEKTKSDYDAIAESFSNTRTAPHGSLRFLFDDYVKKGDKVLDLGCGNGRYYQSFAEKGATYVGVDNSKRLIKIAKILHPEAQFALADALSLPFSENSFDKIFSLAVLHHFPSRQLRMKFFTEAKRILKPNGVLVATVWDLRITSMIMRGKWKRLSSFIRAAISRIAGRSKLDFNDFFIPWNKDIKRYVHIFSLKELKNLAQASGLQIIKAGVSGNKGSKEGNLYIAAQKLQNKFIFSQ